MRKLYMFNINRKYKSFNQKDMKKIYTILENLFYLNTNKLNFGVSIYNQICKPFNKEKILKQFSYLYPEYKHTQNQIIIDRKEKTILEINNCCLVLSTNVSVSKILECLNFLNEDIFICDFNNSDYFWLKKVVKNNYSLTYN